MPSSERHYISSMSGLLVEKVKEAAFPFNGGRDEEFIVMIPRFKLLLYHQNFHHSNIRNGALCF